MKKKEFWIILSVIVLLTLFYVIYSLIQTPKQNFYLTSQELCGDVDSDNIALVCWQKYNSEDKKSGLCQEPCAEKCATLNFKLSSSVFDCWDYIDVHKETNEEGWVCTRSCKCVCV